MPVFFPRKPVRLRRRRHQVPLLRISQILRWADRHHAQTGHWPNVSSGHVRSVAGEKWSNINQALRLGLRGLPGGSSLARVLAKYRGVRNRAALPRLSHAKVVAWAKAHHRRTGVWPGRATGPIAESPGDTWHAVDIALQRQGRGFTGRSS